MIWGGFVVQTVLGNQEIIHENGADVVRDYQKAAEQGDVNAQSILGAMYYEGKGVQKNYAKAFEWFEKAAEQGHANAQYNLGVMYANGESVPKDYTRAIAWYQKAAEQGFANAQDALNKIKQSTVSFSDMLDKSLSAGVAGAFVGGTAVLLFIIIRLFYNFFVFKIKDKV